MRIAITLISFLAIGFAAGEEAAPAPEAEPMGIDPTLAIVAQDLYVYRQRDLDALMLIAARHAKQKLSTVDEEQLRQCILLALTARESLNNALANLPKSLSKRAKDQLILDVLDYQADVAPRKATQAEVLSTDSVTPGAPAADPSKKPAEPAPAADPAAAPAGTDPIIVRLPPLVKTRNIEGLGKRQLTLGLALYFQTADISTKMESKSPLIQDAVLSYIEKLTPAEFAEPDQIALKEGLIKAIVAKIPEFPADGILIPQLEVVNPDAK
jgi:flagellar basal body-associated protein FliL